MAAPRSCKLKPDPLGRYRPRIGYVDATKTKQKRFNLGTDRTAAEQRAAHIRSIYAKQCEHLGIDFWYEIPLQAANAVANGEPVRWQTTSEPNSYENVMEAATLHDLETLFNVRVETDNPDLIKQGRDELRKWIRDEVRQFGRLHESGDSHFPQLLVYPLGGGGASNGAVSQRRADVALEASGDPRAATRHSHVVTTRSPRILLLDYRDSLAAPGERPAIAGRDH